jgi:uncharacterized protein YecT (DUF1311 family)
MGGPLLVGVAALAFAGAPAAADPPSLACLKTAQSTFELDRCAGRAYRAEEKLLGTVYARALAHRPGDRAQLVRAQRAWLAFREADCDYAESQYRGGTIAPVQRTLCLVRDTADRTAALRAYLAS